MNTRKIVSLSYFLAMFIFTTGSHTSAGTWTNTSDLSGAIVVYSLLEASDGYIYAGTSPNGDVFRTNDGGATWLSTSNLDAEQVPALLEASDGTIYAGTGSVGNVFRYDPASGYSAGANAEALVYGAKSLVALGSSNALALLLIPVGAVIFLRTLRKKR